MPDNPGCLPVPAPVRDILPVAPRSCQSVSDLRLFVLLRLRLNVCVPFSDIIMTLLTRLVMSTEDQPKWPKLSTRSSQGSPSSLLSVLCCIRDLDHPAAFRKAIHLSLVQIPYCIMRARQLWRTCHLWRRPLCSHKMNPREGFYPASVPLSDLDPDCLRSVRSRSLPWASFSLPWSKDYIYRDRSTENLVAALSFKIPRL